MSNTPIVDDAAKGPGKTASYFFDPRCLGLRCSVYSGSTIESCLGYLEAKWIRLMGQETVGDGISWPSFLDQRDGPISKAWNVRSWPNIWVIDAQGIIRHRGLRGSELVNAVEALLRE